MNDYSIYNILNDYNKNFDSICLLYENECHFKINRYYNGNRMISYFKDVDLPFEIKNIWYFETIIYKILYNININGRCYFIGIYSIRLFK